MGVGGVSDAEIYGKYAEELIRLATVLVGPQDAADVVSAAVLRSLATKTWPDVVNHRAYLYRAVLNEARMAHRSRARRRPYDERAPSREGVMWPAEPLPEVLSAIARLSPRQRAVVYLTYWDDLEPATVAALLGISDGSVRRHLARARTKLRSLLDDH
jgi:RNA polymerase sigma factor (sigma-70 family)